MKRVTHVSLVLLLLLASAPALPALAQARQSVSNCSDGLQSSGAVYRVCMPGQVPWNGGLVVFAHGYVKFSDPIAIPESQLVLPDGTYIPNLVNSLGFAFATTSYSTNGLAVQQGLQDLVELVTMLKAQGVPGPIYLVGASEGGLITTLAVEQRPDLFTGGLATCGPIGDFTKQINYWGDFRSVFDYFFPNLLPGTPTDIPQNLIANWDTVYAPRVNAAVLFRPLRTLQLLSVSRAPTDPFDHSTITQTVQGILWYNVFATNDGKAKLDGNPFDNLNRRYSGSFSDYLLNRLIFRTGADAPALAEINQHYQTTGSLPVPLVTLHDIGDPIVPYWHETLYAAKVASHPGARFISIPILRYGHCNFKAAEVLAGFGLLVRFTIGTELQNVPRALPDASELNTYQNLIDQYGVNK
jgi:pimeloyl-ACP methyl ester carboxylesterase